MEKLLSKIKPRHYGIVAFVLACIATYVMLSYEQVLSTGKYIFLQGDGLNQYVPFVKMFLRDLLKGENIWYSWSLSMGMNTALSYAYYVFNPFNFLYIIPVDEMIIAALIYILKTGLSAFFFQKFVSKVFKCEGIESIVFSLFYALCSFNVLYNVIYAMWADALYMLPLICYLIYVLQKEGKWKSLALAYTYLFIVHFYMAYIVGIFSFVVWLILWIAYANKQERKGMLLKYISSVLLAVGNSAFIWLPTLYFLVKNNMQKATEFSELQANFLDIIYNLSWGQMQGADGIYPYIYCGIPTIFLIVLFFFNKKIKRKDKICVAVLGAFLMAGMMYMPLYKFMHAFDFPNMYGFRFVFLFCFLLTAVACKQSVYLKETSRTFFLGTVIGCFVVYALLFFMQAKVEFEYETSLALLIIGNFSLMFLWLIVYFAGILKSNNSTLTVVCIIILCMIEIVSNGLACNTVLGAENSERHYSCYKQSIETGVAMLEEESFYRTLYYNDYVYNSDSWFDYKGISDFNSATNVKLHSCMELLGFGTSEAIIFDMGITPVTKMLFNVKYEINGVSPYIMSSTMPEPIIVKNDNILSLGYMVHSDVVQYTMNGKHVFDNMDSLMSSMVGTEINCYENVSKENVSITKENAQLNHVTVGMVVELDDSEQGVGYITYGIPYKEDTSAYVQFQREESVYALNSPVLLGGYENNVYDRGRLSISYAKEMNCNNEAYEVKICIRAKDQPVAYEQANFCYYHPEELLKAYDILSQNQMNIHEYGNTYILADVTVPEERTVLFTSIPYDEGWTVYVDGVETPTRAVVNGAFLALELEPGYHELEFEYEAPGAMTGMAISGVSICVYGLLIGMEYLFVKKRKAKEGNVTPDVEDRTE